MYIVKTLSVRGVQIRTNSPVERIEPGKVILKGSETIEAETILMATGVTPAQLVKDLPLEKNKRGAIVVDSSMRVKDRPGVWALGDCAAIPSPEGKPYPPLAQFALREAKVLGRNIVHSLRDGEKAHMEPFVYETRGLLAAYDRGADMLTVAGHRVTAVEGGEAALMAHEAAEHDAALVDMQMPEMDGAATIAALRARSPGLPIVAMSGGGADILRRARAHGADATIAKPFRAERMLDTLAAALGGRVEEKAGVF